MLFKKQKFDWLLVALLALGLFLYVFVPAQIPAAPRHAGGFHR